MSVIVNLQVIRPILILSVDDETDIGVLTKEFLEMTGTIRVDMAGSVAEARAAIAGRKYDVIVSDYQMPDEDGIQFLKSLRTSGDMTPFILFTGKGREDVVIEAINNGADAYLQKGGGPISLFAELEHRIGTLVRRHRAEAALLDSESEFRTLFDDNPDGVLLVGIEGNILNCNQAAAHMILMGKEEIVGNNFSDLGVFSLHDMALFKQAMIAKAKGMPISPIMSQILRKDGTVKWVEIRSSILMKEGIFFAFQIIGRDITERKNAEEAVKESERRLSDIINFLPDATFAIDTGGRVIAWNKAIEEMTGVPAVDIIGKTNYEYSIPFYGTRCPILIDLVSIPDEELTQNKYSNIKKEGAVLLAETSLPRPLGRSSVLMCKASLLYDRQGEVVGAIESIRDITESRRTEDVLRAEQEKYIKTFLAVPDVVMISEIETGKILVVNDAVFRVFGYAREELIGKSTLDLGIWFHPEGRAELISLLQEQGRVGDYIEKWRRKSGEVFSAEISADVIFLGSKKVLISVIHDISERMKADKALRESGSHLRTLVQTIPDMVWLKDKDGVYISCNAMFERLFCAKEPDLVGKTDYDFLDREKADLFREHDRKAIEAGKPTSNEEWVTFKEDGHLALLDTIRTPMCDARGTLIGVLGIGRDITERKRAEDEIQCQSATLSILNGIISMANKADDLPHLLENILTESLRLFDFDIGGIYLVDNSTRTARVVCSKGLPPGLLDKIEVVHIDQKPYDTLFIKNEPIINEDPEGIAHVLSNSIGIQSMVSVPLISKGVAIGAMNIASTRRHTISREDRQTLISIGRELGSTINRMLSEEEAKRAANNFQILFNSIDEMIFVLDMQGHILAVNNAVQKLLNYGPEELSATDFSLLHAPERRGEALDTIQNMIDGKIESCPVPFLSKDGNLIEVETKITRGWWNDQEVLIGVSRDVTESRKFDARLQRLNRELLAIKECDRALVKAKTEQEMLDNVCRIVCEVVGYREAWIGMAQNDLVKSVLPVAWSGSYDEYIKELRTTWADDERGHGPTGTAIRTRRTAFIQDFAKDDRMGPWLEFALKSGIRSSIAIPLMDRGTVLGAFTLYSDRIDGFTEDEVELLEEMAMDLVFGIVGLRAQGDREKVEEALRETNRKLNLLSSITRHDINNQLMILNGYLSLIGGKLVDPSLNEQLLKAKSSASRIERMIEFTKTYDDIGLKEPAWYDLKELISTVRAEFATNKIRVSIDIPPGIEMLADPLITKVISNLIDNAIRHGGSVKNIHFSNSTEDGDLLIFCEDDGQGIASDDKPGLFTKGFGKNTGMGLFLSREILGITKIGIRECGVDGKGARFELRVPKMAYRVNGSATVGVSH